MLRRVDVLLFNSLVLAAKAGHLALVETTDSHTKEYRAAVCQVVFNSDTKEFDVMPFGHLSDIINYDIGDLEGPEVVP